MRYHYGGRGPFDAGDILTTVAIACFAIIIILAIVGSITTPALDKNVMEVKQVTCKNTSEDGTDCTLLVRGPGNLDVEDSEYIKVLEPGEELAPEPAEKG